MLLSLTRFLNSNFPTSIPVILIWESYPILPHIEWTESKINKSDTRLVIFVLTFFKRQKLRRFFFEISKLVVEADFPLLQFMHASVQHTARAFWKPRRMLFLGKFHQWLHVCYSANRRTMSSKARTRSEGWPLETGFLQLLEINMWIIEVNHSIIL